MSNTETQKTQTSLKSKKSQRSQKIQRLSVAQKTSKGKKVMDNSTKSPKPTSNHIIIKKSKDKKGKWFVVHTYSGHENKVAAMLKQRVKSMHLTDKIFEIIIPTQNRIKISKGTKINVAEKIFPGYILVKMILTDSSWLTVRTTQGITGFIGTGNKPSPLADKEVKTILKFMKMEAPKYKTSFSANEAVKIIEGPFANFLGTVDRIDNEKGKITVLVSIFGRETPVELDFLQVSKI